jgi:hypothetical protein
MDRIVQIAVLSPLAASTARPHDQQVEGRLLGLDASGGLFCGVLSGSGSSLKVRWSAIVDMDDDERRESRAWTAEQEQELRDKMQRGSSPGEGG